MKSFLVALTFCVLASGPLAFSPFVPSALAQPDATRVQWRSFAQTSSKKVVPEVKAIQFLLRARGFYASQPDGIFGAKTAAAVKAFQSKNGLKADGVVGAATFPKLVRTAKRGDRGDVVRAVQVLLRDFAGHEAQYPYAKMKVDGVFGTKTEGAVRDYQSESQVGGSTFIKVDGSVGPKTWALLFHSIAYS